jgi:Protein of unknown function (DUF1264)
VSKSIVAICLLVVFAFFAGIAMSHASRATQPAAQESKAPVKASPAEGYNVHILAPHLVDGKQMGPYHHYCKVIAPDPQIQCLIYDSTEPNANLVQVEWIYAKKLTRTLVPLREWNKDWHDHKIEIASGRVQVLDLPPDKAKEVADLVATTDGMIYHFYFGRTLPTGKMSVAQAVGHTPMTSAEYKNYESK